jgi:sterol desaturase/sphingolipid hydroxylase (fatty acid hydroxylase superfamily)
VLSVVVQRGVGQCRLDLLGGLGWLAIGFVCEEGANHQEQPPASIPLAALFALLFRLAVGAHRWPALFAGFLVGYLVYDSVHYAVHHPSMRTALGRSTKWRHCRHHFTDPDRDYRVSSPLWDLIMGALSRRSRMALPNVMLDPRNRETGTTR